MTTRQLPFLPGNSFEDPMLRENHRKRQTFSYKNGLPVVADLYVPEDDELDEEYLRSTTEKLEQKLSLTNSTLNSYLTTDYGTDKPSWLSLHRKVLRFYCYFREGVHESHLEQSRVRKCIIYYFLEDDTIQVSEPRQDNSGIPQGTLVKRHRVPKSAGEGFFSVDDFHIGAEVTIYGKTFRIVDCDTFTKEFLKNVGVAPELVDYPEEYPEDQYTKSREDLKATMNPFIKLSEEDHEFKRYLECQHKGRHCNPSKQERSATQQFLQNDRRVLRFYCCWDDRESLYGDFRKFILEYYLSDDTTKISEVNPVNSGRDPFPVFVKRSKIAKPSDGKGHTQYYDETDLAIGKYIEVFSKKFLLYDCDAYTKDYYSSKYGITDFEPIDINAYHNISEKQKPEIYPPKFNGFGSEEDSLSSWKNLVLKAPKKNIKKYIENDKKMLRFGCRLVTDAPEDKGRRFVLTFYLADDTISIFEPSQRNSGIIGGKFLQRQRIKHPEQDPESIKRLGKSEYYKAQDLYVGAVLNIFNHKMELTETDEFTLRYMEGRPQEFELSNYEVVLQRMRLNVMQKNLRLKDAFRSIDKDKSGTITLGELRDMIKDLEMNISEQEIITIMRHFDKDGDGVLNYRDFCESLFPTDFSSELDADHATKQLKKTETLNTSAHHFNKFDQADNLNKTNLASDKIFKIFLQKSENRRLFFQDTFRQMCDKSYDGLLGSNEFKQAVIHILQMNFSNEELTLLVNRFFPESKPRISYTDFIKIVEGTSAF
jgi:Ca2+-binding EF-hand superfamily protein